MLNAESSLRLNLLRFPLIVGVVFVHAYETTVGFAGGSVSIGLNQNNIISEFIRNLISQEIARIAVPIFFLMSGYLFFVGFVWSKENYLDKVKSRIKTLLIPFLFWNIATLLLTALGQSLIVTQGLFSGKNPFIINFSAFDYMRYIFGIGVNPISYQFWFIRDLMLLVLLSPIILYLIKKTSLFYILSLLICWFLMAWVPYLPSAEATLFFSLGCYFAINQKSLFGLDVYGKTIIASYIVVIILDVIFYGKLLYLQRFGILLGVVAGLFMTKYLANTPPAKLALFKLSTASFFVYAAHEPLLSAVRKLAYKVIQPNSDYLILALYLAIPVTVIMTLVFTYHKMVLVFPKFTRLITGGR